MRSGAQYWAFEHINRRGVAVDMPFVRRAAALAAEDAVAIGRRLAELTDGAVSQSHAGETNRGLAARSARRRGDARGADGRRSADDDERRRRRADELSLTRDRVARVLAMLEAKHANGGLNADETKAREAATLRLYGAGAAPKKFARLERAAGRRRAARPVPLRRRRADRPHDPAAERKSRISPVMSSARMVPRRLRSSTRSPTAAATPRLPRRILSTCPPRASLPCSCAQRSLPAREKCSSGRLVGDRGADHAMARRFARRRAGARYFPRQRSRPDAAGYLHDRRRRHPAQGRRARSARRNARSARSRRLALRLRRLRRRAPAHGAGYRIHLEDAEARRIVDGLARGEPMGAGILGRPPRRRKLRPVGRRDARLGDPWPDHHGRAARLRLPRGLPRRHACSWRCHRAAC